MASRRNSKKIIKLISSDLISQVYFRCLMVKDVDVEKVDELVLDVVELNRKYVLRVSRPDGKDNPQLVKAYYAKMYLDWEVDLKKIIERMDSL